MRTYKFKVSLVPNTDGTNLAHYEAEIDLPGMPHPVIEKSGSHGNVLEQLMQVVKDCVELHFYAPGRCFLTCEKDDYTGQTKFIARVYDAKDFVVLDKRLTDLEDKQKELEKEIALLHVKQT